MKKFVAILDYKRTSKLEPVMLSATNVLEAMDEAEKLLNDDIYMINIAEKRGRMYKKDGAKVSEFFEILANRHSGWNTVNKEHGEMQYTWQFFDFGSWSDWELKCVNEQ